MKSTVPIVAAMAGAALWYPAAELLKVICGEDKLLGRVLLSPVNLFTLGTFFAALAIMALRAYRTRCDACWRRLALLPTGEDFNSFDSVQQFSHWLAAQGPRRELRPLRMLHACFECVCRWPRDFGQIVQGDRVR